jgi:predicted nucleotidyltransferase
MRSAEEIRALEERAKELRCSYEVGRAVAQRQDPPHTVFERVLEAIPAGWQRSAGTSARIEYLGRSYLGRNFGPAKQSMRATLRLWSTPVGFIEVIDTSYEGDHPFLVEEQELLESIALRVSEYLEWKQQQLFGETAGAQREHWGWRQAFAEALARAIERDRFGVEHVYLHGSTESGNAGPASDIDLLIVFSGDPEQRRELELFLEGYSACLSEIAHRHTGYRVEGGLLDVSFVDREPPPSQRSLMRELEIG